MTSHKLFQTHLKRDDVMLHKVELQKGDMKTKSDLSTGKRARVGFPGATV